jgi:hypothetical protein
MALLWRFSWRFSEKRRFSPGASSFVARLWRFSPEYQIDGIGASPGEAAPLGEAVAHLEKR